MRCLEAMRIIEILRLWDMGCSQREIAASIKCGKSTVGDVQRRCKDTGVTYDRATRLTNNEIREMLYPDSTKYHKRQEPDWAEIHKVIKGDSRKNLRYIWEEYRETKPDGLSYSQFCKRYKEWKNQSGKNVVMAINRVPGREMFVDWMGDTLNCVTDSETGEVLTAHFFIATLGDSSYPYVEAFPDEKADKWLISHVNAFAWYGGVPRVVVPDNAKVAVTSARYYNPTLNTAYWELAQHYEVAVIPARIRHPRDKGAVEAGVGWLETWLLEWLRGQTFFSFRDLNAAIKERLRELAVRPFQKRCGSRESVFKEVDKPALRPLPVESYEFAEYVGRRVPDNYHVEWGGFYYSVPHYLYKQKVTMRVSGSTIEILNESRERVAIHEHRITGSRYVTVFEHMPPNHQHQSYFNSFDGARYREWAKSVGKNTTLVVDKLLRNQEVEEQAYRSCMGILQMSKKCSPERLEAACGKALSMKSVTFTTIKNILKNGQEKIVTPSAIATPRHENLRGNVWL